MVEINKWMDLFKRVILERGYDYFERGKVKDVHWEGDTVYGKVKGTEEYNVSAEIDGENVGKLSCDCPYAKGQKKCKHMAALLFKVLGGDIYIDDEYDDEYYDEDDYEYYEDYLYECDQHYNNIIDDDYRIDELIDSLDEKRLKDVLKYLLENDNIAKRSFLQYINSEDNNINIEDLKESIDCIFYENSDDEYIGYDEASILWDELNDFVDIEIVPLIGLHRYMEAVELTLHLASSFTEYDIDDSDGIIMGIYSRCEEIISSAICLCSEKEEEKIFQAVVYEVENNFDENDFFGGRRQQHRHRPAGHRPADGGGHRPGLFRQGADPFQCEEAVRRHPRPGPVSGEREGRQELPGFPDHHGAGGPGGPGRGGLRLRHQPGQGV